ncbi:MAG: hypothetical protein QXP60_07920 [Nitrososphaerota archaeon]
MKSWEDILLDKNLPNPIPPPPYTDLDQKFGFVNREEEEKNLLNFINKAKIEGRGYLLFILGNQGKGKTAFLKHIKEKHSYPNSDTLYVYMNFPIELNELNFNFIYLNYLRELFSSPILINIQEKIFSEYKDIFIEKPDTVEKLNLIIQKIKNDFRSFPNELIDFRNLISFVITSTPPSPYYLDIYNYIFHLIEIPNHIPSINLLKISNNESLITILIRFSVFLRTFLGINHTVLIIDDFDIYERNERIYRNLYGILMGFRNRIELLKNFTLIFSGSLTFYEEFIQSLGSNERGRIENWIYPIIFEDFETDHFVDIINRAFTNFWGNYIEEGVLQPDNIFGVFNRDTLRFLYEYKNRDLRETLRKLHDLIEKMRRNGKLSYYIDVKSFIREFKVDKSGLKDIEIKYFLDELDRRVKQEKSSTFINHRLKDILKNIRGYFESKKIFIDVDSEVKISNYYADLVLRVSKENYPPFEVVFEIKMKEDLVNYDEIKSRIEILKNSENRYLYWLTKSPLDNIKINDNFKTRILRDKELNKTELAYLSYLINIPEIFNLNDFGFEDLLFIIKQSGIDIDLILNPPKSHIPINIFKDIDSEIEDILNDYNEQFKSYIKKETIFNKLKERGFNGYSFDYVSTRIDDVSRKLGFKPTISTVQFKIKEIK